MCMSSGCVVLNGRSPGDIDSHPTFVGWQGGSTSVIDSGIVSRPLFPHMQQLAVMPSH